MFFEPYSLFEGIYDILALLEGGEIWLMKSSKEDLRRRGFFENEDIEKFEQCSDEELIAKINSPKAIERSVAVNLLAKRNYIKDLKFVKILLSRLSIEKCLYTKIEICNALEKGNLETAEQMIPYLSRIGHNQHLCLPNKVSKKSSYPLPRDIIARSLGKMDGAILPAMFKVLNSKEEDKISEVIDAIGFLLFYNQEYINKNLFKAITDTMLNYSENDIILWKCVLCLSAFWTQDSINILKKILSSDKKNIIKMEAKRSLKIIAENYGL